MSHSHHFRVGDIVWAKVGRHPFWPGIVCIAPNSNKCIRRKQDGTIFFHVRFFNDLGRRCWTNKIELYSDTDDLLLKYPKCLNGLKRNNVQMKIWNLAIREANSLFMFNREKRIIEFSKKCNLKSSELLGLPASSDKPSTSQKPVAKNQFKAC